MLSKQIVNIINEAASSTNITVLAPKYIKYLGQDENVKVVGFKNVSPKTFPSFVSYDVLMASIALTREKTTKLRSIFKDSNIFLTLESPVLSNINPPNEPSEYPKNLKSLAMYLSFVIPTYTFEEYHVYAKINGDEFNLVVFSQLPSELLEVDESGEVKSFPNEIFKINGKLDVDRVGEVVDKAISLLIKYRLTDVDTNLISFSSNELLRNLNLKFKKFYKIAKYLELGYLTHVDWSI